jgi:hypothetical protein
VGAVHHINRVDFGLPRRVRFAPIATADRTSREVRLVPTATRTHCGNDTCSIASAAVHRIEAGIVMVSD